MSLDKSTISLVSSHLISRQQIPNISNIINCFIFLIFLSLFQVVRLVLPSRLWNDFLGLKWDLYIRLFYCITIYLLFFFPSEDDEKLKYMLFEFVLTYYTRTFLETKFCHYISRDSNWTRTHNHLVRKRTLNHLPKLAKNDWAVLWVIICTVYLTVCSCHVTYAFQSEFTVAGLQLY